MPNKPESVEKYFEIGCGRCKFGGTPQCKVHSWENILRALRAILNESELQEEVKWGAPCYTHAGRNILMLSALKDCVVLSFFRGAELDDPLNLLEKPGENSRFARYVRFKDSDRIQTQKPAILKLISKAIKLEESGKRTEKSEYPDLEYPEELIRAFENDSGFEEAFSSLTPGRQRGYLLHFTSAKQSSTKSSRIEKCKPKILKGKGWNEY